MRTLLVAVAAAAVVIAASGCGSSKKSAAQVTLQREADLYQIDQIEVTWHKAASTHNLNLIMSLWAPNATFNVKGQTFTGLAAIRQALGKAGPFQPQNHWISDTPAYKLRATVNGDVGTLYFECHYIDTRTGKLQPIVGADQNLKKINGVWKITNFAASSPTLTS
jgi:ketosteroid isomerase-like protein